MVSRTHTKNTEQWSSKHTQSLPNQQWSPKRTQKIPNNSDLPNTCNHYRTNNGLQNAHEKYRTTMISQTHAIITEPAMVSQTHTRITKQSTVFFRLQIIEHSTTVSEHASYKSSPTDLYSAATRQSSRRLSVGYFLWSEWLTGKDLEGRGLCLFEVVFSIFLRGWGKLGKTLECPVSRRLDVTPCSLADAHRRSEVKQLCLPSLLSRYRLGLHFDLKMVPISSSETPNFYRTTWHQRFDERGSVVSLGTTLQAGR